MAVAVAVDEIEAESMSIDGVAVIAVESKSVGKLVTVWGIDSFKVGYIVTNWDIVTTIDGVFEEGTADESTDVEEYSVVLKYDGVAEGMISVLEEMIMLGVFVDDECETKLDADAVLMFVSNWVKKDGTGASTLTSP